jgi:hypothetical protein
MAARNLFFLGKNEIQIKPLVVGLTFLILISIGVLATPYMVAATISYFLLVTGLIYRKEKIIHARLMMSGIFIDLLIVGILELSRDAVKTAIEMRLDPLQQFHILASTIAVVFYIPVVILGYKRFKGKATPAMAKAHGKLGILAFIFRSLGFILMFSLIGLEK